MGRRSLDVQLPVGSGTALAAYCHDGSADYHEQQALAGYALRVAQGVWVGVAARWLHTGISDAHYESRQWLAPSALLRVDVGRSELTLVGGTRPWDDEHLWRLHLQAAYSPMPQLTTLAEVEREECTRLRLGMEYAIDECWMLRAGMATQPVVLTFGAGLRRGMLAIDLAVEAHNTLGLTPSTSLSLWF